MSWQQLSPNEACLALRDAGLELSASEVTLEKRTRGWVARLPDEKLAFFAASSDEQQRLVRERRVLRLIRDRCSFEVPRVVYEAADGSFDVRTVVAGSHEPFPMYELALQDCAFARRAGQAFGRILVEQHSRVPHESVRGWLPEPVAEWPRPQDWTVERVRRVADDPELLAQVELARAAYGALRPGAEQCALIHGDLGFHNAVFDPVTRALRGVFDYDSAAWADRHLDFRYLLFDRGRDELLESALSVYEPALGLQLHRPRIALYNVVCAFAFLAHRLGTAPDQLSCGRTLAEDLRWCRRALARWHEWQ